jgi:hypothetical protein
MTDDERRERFEAMKAAIAKGASDVVAEDAAGNVIARNPQTALDTPAPTPPKDAD